MQNNPQLVLYSLILQKHIFFKDRTENIFYILTSLTTCVPQSQKWGHGVNGQCLADTVSGTNMFLYSSGSKFGLPIVCSSQHFLCEICVVCSFFFCFFCQENFSGESWSSPSQRFLLQSKLFLELMCASGLPSRHSWIVSHFTILKYQLITFFSQVLLLFCWFSVC